MSSLMDMLRRYVAENPPTHSDGDSLLFKKILMGDCVTGLCHKKLFIPLTAYQLFQ